MALPAAKASKATPRSELFRLFAEEGRLQVLALCAESELSVGELSSLLRDSQPQLSRKVAALREARRDGTHTWVKLSPTQDVVVTEAIAEGRRLCLKDGSLVRLPKVLAAREEPGLKLFEANGAQPKSVPPSPEHLA